MFKYYNHRLVKQYRSYTVEQICNLFKVKKLHPQTVREWVKSGELEAISKKPISIYGEVLKDFLEKRNANNKRTLEFNQFKCLKCREVISPKDNTISIYKNKNGSLKAVATCPSCDSETMRFYKGKDHKKLEETFAIKQADVTTLYNQLPSTSKTNLDSAENNTLCESSKIDTDQFGDSASKTNLTPKQTSLFDYL